MQSPFYLFFIIVLNFVCLSSCSNLNQDKKSAAYKPPTQRKLRPLPSEVSPPHPSELSGLATNVIWNVTHDVSDSLSLTNDLKEGVVHSLKAKGIKIREANNQKTKHLIEEIERARKNSHQLNYQGDQKVDYYIRASITKSANKTKYSSPIWCPMCSKDRKGTCKFDQQAAVQIEVLTLPDLLRAKHVNIEADESFSMDVHNQCAHYNNSPESKSSYIKNRGDIVEKLIKCTGYSLVDFLSPKAYIEKYFSDGKAHIYQLSAGKTAGFVRGDKVSIFQKTLVGETLLGEAKVIAVKQGKSFVAVKDKTLRDQIRQYDLAKVQHSDLVKRLSCSKSIKR